MEDMSTRKEIPGTGILFAVLLATVVATVPVKAQVAVRNQGYIPFSDPPINYRSDDLHDPVAQLSHALQKGDVKLEFDADHGYLPSVLKLLAIPVSSQALVFSKTSFQYPKISPAHPRALYFNDDVYVGSVHEGKAVEIVSFDPMQGAIFYLLDEHQAEHPKFERAELDCTQCHIAAGTRGVPGVLLRSVYPTAEGTLALGTRSFITDQESPLTERWGGWYLTGPLGRESGLGNSVVDAGAAATSSDGATHGPPLALLKPQFATSEYLSSSSDAVAQLVLAHQTQMHNLITLTNYRTRIALAALAKSDSPLPDPLPDETRRQFEKPAEQLLRYLLFVNEAALPPGGHSAATASAFAKDFAQRGPRDPKGRSLRDFDLTTRIFKYPCSYLIYSDAFDHLPEPAKGYLFHRLFEVLSDKDKSADFARLDSRQRHDILEILLATKNGLPAEWRAYGRANHVTVADMGHETRLDEFNQAFDAYAHVLGSH